jgi:TPR repeat protein
VKWYRLAAEQGNVAAQYNLGLMYAKGQGVPQNQKTAVKWYTLAAKQGNAGAQFNLGWMYGKGQGIPQDYKTVFFKRLLTGLLIR